MRNIDISKSDEDLLSEYYAQCSWPKAYYSNLTNLARLTQGKRILEVGVAYGYHADYILEQINNYGYDIDVMLECKAKELALLEYRKTQLETIQ